jgi:hypothetical protein
MNLHRRVVPFHFWLTEKGRVQFNQNAFRQAANTLCDGAMSAQVEEAVPRSLNTANQPKILGDRQRHRAARSSVIGRHFAVALERSNTRR